MRTYFASAEHKTNRGGAGRSGRIVGNSEVIKNGSTEPHDQRNTEVAFNERIEIVGGEKIMSTNTIRLHRVLRATPEKGYRAFLDADAKAKWLPPNGFTAKVHHTDARVGGTYKMSFTNFTTGH